LVLAAPTFWWQDLLSNYFNHVYVYNSYLVNFGAWYNFIPGWSSPRANHIAESAVFTPAGSVFVVVPPVLLIAGAMRRAKCRWPEIGKSGMFLVGSSVAIPILFVLEVFWVRLGLYAFAGTIPALTLFHGHYYQYPVYEAFMLAGLFFVPLAALVYFRDDKGRTICERGVDEIRATPRRKTFLRWLGFVGAINLAQILYSVPFMLISLLPWFSWSNDIATNRSYLRDQLCGTGTSYACPGKDIPIPRRGGAHVDPEGRLVPGE
jgi:hypothetical protein